MPRGPRIVVPGIALHIVQRGHNRRDCFQHETDYLVYLANLRKLLTRVALRGYRDLFAADDDPAFLAAIRDATYRGFALVGEQLKVRLPANLQRRLERRSRPSSEHIEPESADALTQLALELGLRPRTG